MTSAPPIATLREATSPADCALARALFVEYARWLGVDLCFQGFDRELATLPGAYAPPLGRLLLAGVPGSAHGCIALRRIDTQAMSGNGVNHESAQANVGEVKRLYVQPEHRNGGWGRRLAQALIVEARAIGYTQLKLDTLEWMGDARKLYASLGFHECAPYYDNPLPGVIYMALALQRADGAPAGA